MKSLLRVLLAAVELVARRVDRLLGGVQHGAHDEEAGRREHGDGRHDLDDRVDHGAGADHLANPSRRCQTSKAARGRCGPANCVL